MQVLADHLTWLCAPVAGLSSPFVSGSSSPGHLPKNAVGLDGWLLSEDATRACLLGLSADADISLIEGCLGMFDSPSADGSEQGSTAQIAQSLQVPVVLVVDASTFNTVRGVVALVKGYTAVDGSSSIAGVILNKVTSTTLAAEVQEGLKQADVNVAVLGAVPLVSNCCPLAVTVAVSARHHGLHGRCLAVASGVQVCALGKLPSFEVKCRSPSTQTCQQDVH